MNDTFALSIVLFLTGVFLLRAFRRDWTMLTARWKTVEKTQRELTELFARRAERLPILLAEMRYFDALQPLSDELRQTLKQREATTTAAEASFQSEQKLSGLLHRLSSESPQAKAEATADAALDSLLSETRDREDAIAAARERYNEAAEAWNAYQRMFPLGLLARAITPKAATLFEGLRSSGFGLRKDAQKNYSVRPHPPKPEARTPKP